MRHRNSECGFCGKRLPEPPTDSILIAKGRFYHGEVCVSCLKKYKLTITKLLKVVNDERQS